LVLAQLSMQRESVSGVSLDEEMTNMIKFQRSFEAAARIVRTTDELIQTILQMV
jgi:flagellar hook-associated protein 1 FlgK